jgi:hypothetical protein
MLAIERRQGLVDGVEAACELAHVHPFRSKKG